MKAHDLTRGILKKTVSLGEAAVSERKSVHKESKNNQLKSFERSRIFRYGLPKDILSNCGQTKHSRVGVGRGGGGVQCHQYILGLNATFR